MKRVSSGLERADLPAEERNPILVPVRHHIATLLTLYFRHQGRYLTEEVIRVGVYWVTGGKRLDSFLLHKYVKYRRFLGNLSQQKMANLPADRSISSPPFTFVGVDVFYPWNIVTRRTRGIAASEK